MKRSRVRRSMVIEQRSRRAHRRRWRVVLRERTPQSEYWAGDAAARRAARGVVVPVDARGGGVVVLVAITTPGGSVPAKPVFERMTRFWGLAYLVNYAVGIGAGLVMEFQLGMNWSGLRVVTQFFWLRAAIFMLARRRKFI